MITWQMENLGAWTDPVTEDRSSTGQFRASWTRTIKDLSREIELLGGVRAVVQVVVVDGFIRRDGMLSARATVGHPGVVVSFDSDVGPLRYACDQYEQRWASDLASWQGNVRAIALGLGALRAVDRYGISSRREQYVGYRALPAGRGDASSGMTATDAVGILLRAADFTEPHTVAIAQDRQWWTRHGSVAVRAARAATHPDRHAGDTAQWHLVDNAEQTLRAAGWLPRAVTS